MLKIILKLSAVIGMLFFLFFTSASLIGKGISTDVAFTLASLPSGVNVEKHRPIFSYIDLNRAIITRSNTRVSPVVDIQLFSGKAILMTRDKTNVEEIYLYDLYDHTYISLLKNEEGRRKLASVMNFGISFAGPTFQKMAYHNPDDDHIHVLDLTTGESTTISKIALPRTATPLRWSSDYTQIAYQVNTMIHIVNVDGTNPRSFEQSASNFYFDWSPDGSQIYVHNYNISGTGKPKIRLFDPQTGEIHQRVNDLATQNISLNWYACPTDEPRAAYNRMGDLEDKSDYVLVNLDTGEEVILSDHPALQGIDILFVSWWNDCEHLLLYAKNDIPSSQISFYPYNQFYLMDMEKGDVTFIAEGTMLGWNMDENRIFYQAETVEDEDRAMHIYAKDMNNPSAPEEYIGSYTVPQNTWFQWMSSSYEKALYLSPQYGTNANMGMGRASLMVVDIVTGESYPISHPADYITNFIILNPR